MLGSRVLTPAHELQLQSPCAFSMESSFVLRLVNKAPSTSVLWSIRWKLSLMVKVLATVASTILLRLLLLRDAFLARPNASQTSLLIRKSC